MWFTETPWPPILIFIVVAVISFVIAVSQQRKIYLLGVVFMIVCSTVSFFVERQIVTEREKVEAVIHDLGAAVTELDIKKTMDYVSDSAEWIRVDIRIGLGMIKTIDRLSISDLDVTMKLQNSRAVTHFRANGSWTIGDYAGHSATRWRLTWQKEEGNWKIIKVERLHPMNGQVIGFLMPQ